MKKILWICGILICIAQLTFAQGGTKNTDIIWGPEQKESNRVLVGDIIGSDESGIYVMKKKRRGGYGINYSYMIEHYDTKMARTKTADIPLKYQKKDTGYEDILHVNGNLYLFTSYTNKKLKKRFLFVQLIDKKTLKTDTKLTKIAEINIAERKKQNIFGAMLFGIQTGYNLGSFNAKISQDESKVMVYYQLPDKKGSEAKEKLGFHVFDSNMTEIWSRDITLPYEDDLFWVSDYQISNQGNAYLLGKEYEESRREVKRGEPNFKFRVLSYINNGEDLEEYIIKSDDHFLSKMQIRINPNEDILCGGFYSEVDRAAGIKGSYFMRVDGKSKEVVSKSFSEFGYDFITQHMTERQEKKAAKREKKGKNVNLYRYQMDDIIVRDDGGAILIAEQFYTYTTSYTNSQGRTTYTTNYVFNDIIAINIDPDGQIAWTQKIPKRQRESNSVLFSSYALAVVGDKLYFVFNDHKDNLKYKGDGDLERFSVSKRNGVVMLVEVNAEGKVKRQKLFSTKDADVITKPLVSKQVSADELIIFGEKRKKERFAKVLFK